MHAGHKSNGPAPRPPLRLSETRERYILPATAVMSCLAERAPPVASGPVVREFTHMRWQNAVTACGLLALVVWAGCGGGGSNITALGNMLFPAFVGNGTTTGPGSTGTSTGSDVSSGSGGFTDPCSEPQARKFVRISMRNASEDYVHYFVALIALVNSDTYPEGSVCADDIALYTSFGYTSIPAGATTEFGNYCITGPALLYFHRGGQFRTAGGSSGTGLGSAIAPAQGSTPTYDLFFTSSGATVPVPDFILFHNPGTTAGGQALLVSRHLQSPCTQTVITGVEGDCSQDAFYYVDDTDRMAGSSALGAGSGRRTPAEIQGTGCQCGAVTATRQQAMQVLASSSTSALQAECNEFFRGGRVEYVFVRNDTDPPFPQLVWRVTDASGGRAHDFDSRAQVR
jgi:hypothetical protein